MKITEEQVRHVSRLARLRLEQKETERLRKELSAILDYMDMLNEVDTKGIEPTFHAHSITNAMRDDEVVPSQSRDDALLNAPKTLKGAVVVPRVIE
jgi:aspartyl-tRNA(Asn)/glutamyl-tRNA(Gln) amidotransferase subunit C